MLRITGKVTRTDVKSGSTPQADKITGVISERPWSFTVVRVLVAGQDIAECSIFADNTTAVPAVGDDIDYAVELNKGRAQVYKPWADLFPATAGVRRVS